MMPIFEIQGPDGATYEVDAPDQSAALDGFKRFGSAQAGPAPDPTSGRLGGRAQTVKQSYVPSDIAASVVGGVERGAVGMAGLPGFAVGLLDTLADGAARSAPVNWLAGNGFKRNDAPASRPRFEVPSPSQVLPQPADVIRAYEGVRGPTYQPQTTAGKYAASVGEMVGSGGRGLPALGAGLLSEAAGQLTHGTVLEPYARAAGALGGGFGVAAAQRSLAGPAESIVSRAAGRLTPQQADAAEALFRDAQAAGVPITRAEAVQQVTGGATRLGDLQRVVEGQGGLRPMMAERPGQIEAAGRSHLDTIAPAIAEPAELGGQIRQAADTSVRLTPEGQASEQARGAMPSRITPEQAGQQIQPDLHKVYSRMEERRASQAASDYGAARASDSYQPIGQKMVEVTQPPYAGAPPASLSPAEFEGLRSNVVRAMMREGTPLKAIDPSRVDLAAQALARGVETEPVAAYAAGERWAQSVKTEIPQTLYGQVNPASVVRHIDEQLAHAKGGTLSALQDARRALFTRGGEIDGSVEGLHNARGAIDELIGRAQANQQPNAERVLMGVREKLDGALAQVPEYERARARFERNSQPMAPFSGDRAPGKIVARDAFDSRFTIPTSRNLPSSSIRAQTVNLSEWPLESCCSKPPSKRQVAGSSPAGLAKSN